MSDNFFAAAKQIFASRTLCLACEKKPERLQVDRDVCRGGALGIRFVAICHGSRSEFKMDDEQIDDEDFSKMLAWASGLFPLDGFPDMKELLKYNREPWRFDDVR